MAQSSNVNVNAFQVLLGFFTYTSHTSDQMIETLTHADLSISLTSINNTIAALSIETKHKIRALGQILLANNAYNNFDIAFDVKTPTVEHGGSSLVHLTSGTLLQLEHVSSINDL